jgi:hypothetical protein
MEVERERQRGLEAGRRWARSVAPDKLAAMANGSFDDFSQMLPLDTSDQFVGGFREAVPHVWRGA